MMLLGGPLVLRAAAVTGGVVGALSLTAACAPDGKFLTWGGPLAIGLGGVCMACLGKWNRYHLLTVLWRWSETSLFLILLNFRLIFTVLQPFWFTFCQVQILITDSTGISHIIFFKHWDDLQYILQAWCSSYYLMNSTNVEVMYLAKLEICIIFVKVTK